MRDLRTWMKNHGYQDRPLIVTEYGALYPLWYLDDFFWYDGQRISQSHIDNYIANVINWVNNTTDASLGYPADANRLVQQTALYSLDDDSVFPPSAIAGGGLFNYRALGEATSDEILYRWGSFLFHSTSPYTLTATGAAFTANVSTLTANVDLIPYRWYTEPGALIISPTQQITPTVKLLVSNTGNAAPPISPTIRFRDVTGGGNTLLGNVSLPPFTGCGAWREASLAWPNLAPGGYSLVVEVDPDSQIAETNESNNVLTLTILVGTKGSYLPMVQK
jgi:hypothetical protein